MIDEIVVDVEIAHCIGDVVDGKKLGWDDTDKLGISVAVVYEYKTDRFRLFGGSPEEAVCLQARLRAADRITTFNGWKFDFPVIFGLAGRERVEELRPKSNDLLVRIWQGLGLDPKVFTPAHGGWGLDAVASGTLGYGKSGNGADAPKWFQEGKLLRVVDYCLDDVRIERDLGAFIERYGFVVRNDGRVVKIKPLK